MTPISICVIAKNEEKHMPQFLSSIKKQMGDHPFELVIVDTGSTDNTVAIAKNYTDRIFYFEWIKDFSAARNYSLQCASNDWCLILDCDEYITDLDTSSFQMMIQHHPDAVGMITLRNNYEMNGTNSIYINKLERFFSRKLFHYCGVVHEHVCSIEQHDYQRISISLVADHQGYNGSADELLRKVERNNELLFQMLEETPDDPYLYFQLGQSYNMLHNDEKAYYYYGKGLSYDLDPNLDYVQMMVIGYGYCMLHLHRYEEALQFRNIYEEFATTADFVCLMGLIYLRNSMVVQAMSEFLKATTFASSNTEGANSFIPTFNMGCINEVLGDIPTAITLYKKCGSFKPALDRLEELT